MRSAGCITATNVGQREILGCSRGTARRSVWSCGVQRPCVYSRSPASSATSFQVVQTAYSIPSPRLGSHAERYQPVRYTEFSVGTMPDFLKDVATIPRGDDLVHNVRPAINPSKIRSRLLACRGPGDEAIIQAVRREPGLHGVLGVAEHHRYPLGRVVPHREIRRRSQGYSRCEMILSCRASSWAEFRSTLNVSGATAEGTRSSGVRL